MTTIASSDDLLAAQDELRAAMLAGDVGTLDRLLDDDLMFVSHLDAVVGKAGISRCIARRRLRIRGDISAYSQGVPCASRF